MLQTSANPTRRINASSCFYYAVPPSFAAPPFILVRCPYLLTVSACACVCTLVFLLVGDLQTLSQRGLNHSSSHGLSRAMSDLSYQSIDTAPALPLGGQCSGRPRPRHGGILMGMQIASVSATSAGIDPPADFHCGDRWTVTSERAEIGTAHRTSPSAGLSRRVVVQMGTCRFICPLLSIFIFLSCSVLIPHFPPTSTQPHQQIKNVTRELV